MCRAFPRQKALSLTRCRKWILTAHDHLKMPRHPLVSALMVWAVLGGCASQNPLVERRPSHESPAQLDAWLQDHPLGSGNIIRIDELERSARASAHMVQIRDREPLHIHVEHDLDVSIRRGRGTMIFGDQRIKLKEGDFIKIPRGVPHAYINESKKPSVAYVEFIPPFDGIDSLAVK